MQHIFFSVFFFFFFTMVLLLVCFAGYRQDGSTECTRTITDLASACETLAVLSARSYYQGFKVAKVIKMYRKIYF